MNNMKDDCLEKEIKHFRKSIKKEVSKYLIKSAVENDLLNAQTGEKIMKNFI